MINNVFRLILIPFITLSQQSYLQVGLRPPPSVPPISFSRNPALRNYGKTIGDSLDAGLFRQYLTSELYQEGSLKKDKDCEHFPNSTMNSFHVYQCDDQKSVTLHNMAITNYRGEEVYPINMGSYIRIFIDLTNHLKRRIDDLTIEVSAYKRSRGWLGCGWLYLPSFALLNNEDVCANNPSCPLPENRRHVLEIPIVSSQVFTRLLRLFHLQKDVYQFEFRFRERSKPFNDLFCFNLQTRVTV